MRLGRPKLNRKAECHPDRQHEAKGMCYSCYMKHLRKTSKNLRDCQYKCGVRWRKNNNDKFLKSQMVSGIRRLKREFPKMYREALEALGLREK